MEPRENCAQNIATGAAERILRGKKSSYIEAPLVECAERVRMKREKRPLSLSHLVLPQRGLMRLQIPPLSSAFAY
jgi:hypothetical protein